jgi:hypothetical protein
MSPFYTLTDWTTTIPIDWAICNVKVKSRPSDKDAGYSKNNVWVVLTLAFLPPSAVEMLEAMLAECGVAVTLANDTPIQTKQIIWGFAPVPGLPSHFI